MTKTKTQQTPGPWKVVGPLWLFDGEQYAVTGDGINIVTTGIANHRDDAIEFLANARLIAAAPEMFDALNKALIILATIESESAMARKVMEIGRAALNKAEGR